MGGPNAHWISRARLGMNSSMPNTDEKAPEKTVAHPHLKAYTIVANAVHAGVVYGHGRAHKHTQTPDADALREAIYSAVMLELTEVLNFDVSYCLPLLEQDASEDQTS
jgi:hypothetical protein